jgi:hypothetical protein
MNNPKDKAGDLIVKFIKHSRAEKDIKPIDSAKQCALIAVDELIEFAYNYTDYNEKSTKEYLEKVKKEIEQL